jgi:hypothetical protein
VVIFSFSASVPDTDLGAKVVVEWGGNPEFASPTDPLNAFCSNSDVWIISFMK